MKNVRGLSLRSLGVREERNYRERLKEMSEKSQGALL